MKYFFDILILILLTSTVLPAIFLLRHFFKTKKSWEQKHKKLTISIVVILILGFLTVFYGSFIEPNTLIVRHEKIDLKKVKDPIKIALIADLQVGPYKQEEYLKKITKKIIELDPDLVFMAGDHVNNSGDGIDESIYLKPLKDISSKYPIYAVHGNHEYGVSNSLSRYSNKFRVADLSNETEKQMESIGVHYFKNDLEVIDVQGVKFNLFGADSLWANKMNPSILKYKNTDLATIALVHNPAAAYDLADHNIDLILAGHTHGGQIRLPFIGPLVKVDRFLPRSWHKGWIKYKNTDMYVTSGAGETGVRARLYNPPEIVLLTIY